MRTIKFRAWDKREKIMYDVFGIAYQNGKIFSVDLSQKNNVNKWTSIEEVELMQFTGLHDNNGKEIYEGDVVKVIRKHWYCPGHPKHNQDLIDNNEVYWDEERNGMSRRTIDLSRKTQPPYSSSSYLGSGWKDERADENIVEVIGNKFENPELLVPTPTK